jgi:hypothetical protein
VGGSSLPETRPISEIAQADLESRLTRQEPLAPEDVSRLVDRVPHLRRLYNGQLQRAKILFVDPRLTLESCRPLLLLARSTVSVSHRVYPALRFTDDAATAPAWPVVTAETIEAALAWNDVQLDRIVRHLQGLDAADAHASRLRALLDRLEVSSRASSGDWTRLARDVISVACARLDSGPAVAVPGFSLQSYFTEIGHARHAEIVARGIEAAQNVARFLALHGGFGFDPELLTIAALAQDCGLLLRPARVALKAVRAAQELRALHASIGAGLAAALVEYSTELPALVAEHHRRLNELQSTHDSFARIQNRSSRLLAVVVRWLELSASADLTPASTPIPSGRLAVATPVERLLAETLRGDWDRQLVRELLATLGFAAESETLREPERGHWPFENRDARRRRFDSADQRWPHPNLELAARPAERQPREKQHVRASAE